LNRDEAFDTLNRMAKGIAEMFGSNCETVINDMADPKHPVLAIYNGHVSGRTVGSTQDITGITQNLELNGDVVNLLAVTPTGQQTKSSTFSIRGEDYHFAFGINYDFTPLAFANRVLLDLMHTEVDFRSAIYKNREAGISDLFDDAVIRIGKPIREMTKADRLHVIEILRDVDAFSYRRAVPYVATHLGVSRYTVYKYLDELGGKDASPRDAIDDMHRYRDAILYRRQKAGLSREIIGAYVLFPGRLGHAYDYAPMRDQENIGAFPLLPQPAYTERFGEFLKGLLDFGSKKEHLSKAMPPRGAEISLQPVVTEEMILTVSGLSISEEESAIVQKRYVAVKSTLPRPSQTYRQVRFSRSGNADMYAMIKGGGVREGPAKIFPPFPGQEQLLPDEMVVWFDLV